MSLISATVSLAVTLGKTGIQHGDRPVLQPEVDEKSRYSLPQLYTTILGMARAGRWSCWRCRSDPRWCRATGSRREVARAAVVSVLVLVQVLDSRSGTCCAPPSAPRVDEVSGREEVPGLGCLFGGLLLVSKSCGRSTRRAVLAEGTRWFLPGPRRSGATTAAPPKRFSRPLYGELLRFGLPMTFGYEMAGVILSVGDRYIIKAKIGENQLGLYSAAYNLASTCRHLHHLDGPGISPIYTRMYHEEGAEKTSAFASQSLSNYCWSQPRSSRAWPRSAPSCCRRWRRTYALAVGVPLGDRRHGGRGGCLDRRRGAVIHRRSTR